MAIYVKVRKRNNRYAVVKSTEIPPGAEVPVFESFFEGTKLVKADGPYCPIRYQGEQTVNFGRKILQKC